MTRVVNKYKHTPDPDHDVYIGRGSGFGNPYSHLDSKYGDTIKVDTREEAVEKFKEVFNARMNPSDPDEESDLYGGMYKLLKLAKRQDINLVCYCKPHPCHGDVIKEWLDKNLENDNNRTI